MLLMRIAIIGGGAAGMMAAATIVEQNFSAPGFGAPSRDKVILIERNRVLGQKVRRTGGGRCNVTTGLSAMDDILRRYPRGRNFLKHAFYEFPPWQVMEWFSAHGVPLKTEPDQRVFPKSDRSEDIVAVFEQIFQKYNVEIFFGTTVTKVSRRNQQFILDVPGRAPLIADRLIIATGGQPDAKSGGYAFAEDLGHTITPLAPSLTSFTARELWIKTLAGVSFPSARLRLKGTKDHEFTGPFVFTHQGVTGPAVFALSSLAAYEVLSPEKPARLLIDLLPDREEAALLRQLRESIAAHPKKTFANILASFIPRSVAETACRALDIQTEKIGAEISKKDLNKSLSWLKGVPLTVIGRAAGEEFVTAGGVSLKEVDGKTMQSKICPGLFFAGEALDVDAFTGGFNLQAAWATGRLAGHVVARAT